MNSDVTIRTALDERSDNHLEENDMKLMRGIVLLLAVMLPTTWTLAHAADEGAAGSGGEMKEGKSKKKSKKKEKKESGAAGSGGEMK